MDHEVTQDLLDACSQVAVAPGWKHVTALIRDGAVQTAVDDRSIPHMSLQPSRPVLANRSARVVVAQTLNVGQVHRVPVRRKLNRCEFYRGGAIGRQPHELPGAVLAKANMVADRFEQVTNRMAYAKLQVELNASIVDPPHRCRVALAMPVHHNYDGIIES